MTTNAPLPSTIEEPPPPRRTDDAFAFAVGADVAAIRAAHSSSWRTWRWGLLPVAAAAAVVFLVRSTSQPGEIDVVGTANFAEVATLEDTDVGALEASLLATLDADDERPSFIAVLDAVLEIDDDETLLALSGSNDPRPTFAFEELDGSSEQDLAAVEAALDRALAPL